MRLPPQPGEWIARDQPLPFRFEGREYVGFAGDTVTSALLANGVKFLGRSFKYHRRRGVLSFANHDVNAMFQAGQRLNLRGDVEPLAAGMELRAVNTFGGLAGDRAALLDRFSAILPVGFYYKAFHTPRPWFARWERLFRKVTGLGELRFDTPRIPTPKRYDSCDVLVAGGGASGLSAAIAAARAGARVVVVDENARAGGSLAYADWGGQQGRETLAELLGEAERHSNIEIRTGTVAAGFYADLWVPLVDGAGMTKMRCRALVAAGGVYEQPAVFRNNDLPGVMLASAAQRLIARHAVKPFTRVLVLAANADGYGAALDFLGAGIEVIGLVDLRPEGEPEEELRERALHAGIRVTNGQGVFEALAGADGAVEGALVGRIGADGVPDNGTASRLACDGLVMSVGWAPAAALLYQSGATLGYDETIGQFVPLRLPDGIFACGRINGVHALHARRADGERAGLAAARFLGLGAPSPAAVAREATSRSHPWPFVHHPRGKNFVDFDEDLQLKDFFNAAQEGFDNIELLKRYTTVGMGPSQGKHSNMNAIRILARIRGDAIDAVGSTTARPFFHPVPMSALAGRGFHPERTTPLHPRHAKLAAKFMHAGAWLRPEYYSLPDSDRGLAVREEVRAVRSGVGVIDVGTLGKMEVCGADAGEFLERVYTGRFANMKVGSTRYALMLEESGVIIDDGVVARLAEDRFYFTTTTTGSVSVYREITRLNTLWGLRAGIVNVTGAYAAVNLAGPKARALLAPLADLDLSEAAFPFLGVREGQIAGVPARLMRVGFVGETGWEIHVPAEYGPHLWDALMEAGRPYGIRPFGVEAQRVLRLEKGHPIIGQDTDGLTTPYEAGLEWALKMDKPFFVGQRSLRILGKKPPRQRLVGFELAPEARPRPRECHLVIDGDEIAGRVTSISESEASGRIVGLAYVKPSRSQPGSRFAIRADGGRQVQAVVAKTPFYDPAGERQKL
jgi:sarcosine oxidase subunit alpha